jgi:protein-S-isoprenylcysteine O-methyltransferase Ste14
MNFTDGKFWMRCLIFVAHAVIMLGHKQKLMVGSGDKPRDPLYSQAKAYLAFGAMLLGHAYFIWHSTQEEFIENDALFYTGAVIFVAGAALRLWAVRLLGHFFTYEIGIRSTHKIIENGPYALIRHPSYTGYLIMLLGAGLSCSSWLFVTWAILSALSFLVIRIYQEERMLVSHFGDQYREYQKRTWRLIPYLF